MSEKPIGEINHWYDKLGVAVIKLKGVLKVGDALKIRRGEEEAEDAVVSMQIDHKEVLKAKSGDEVAIKLNNKAKEGAVVYKVE